ncbi:glycosyltransferase [Bacillus sp. AGMB 02131]|uniref:Glycosyltransferase n=1 Tax=Peribacillus faecalis TaxID=2772559 RepID=A0A927CUV5_9BACI|nr:glycosyltransferase [Peribacillus faecalis]MBD3107614.1 glycosyltransferase [Peribacillus faecalis]
MKRVLVVGGMARGGGISKFLMTTYSNIQDKELRFDFVSEFGKNDYKEEMDKKGWGQVSITPIKENVCKHLIEWYLFLKHHAKEYEAIHFHYDSLHKFMPFYWAKKFKIPKIIVHSHNSYNDKNNIIKMKLHNIGRGIVAKNATHFFACSSKAAKWFYEQEILSENKIQIIKNGIDLDSFKYSPVVRGDIREELNINEKFVIGHVGRFETQKNHKFLIQVFHQIYMKNKNAVLLLIGDGNTKKEIIEMVNSLNLKDSVKILGLRNDVSKLIQGMDVLLFPSLYEGLPLTLIEAQTAGLPCFISDSIASETKCSEFVSFLSLEDKPEKWADAILKEEHNHSRNRCNGYFQVKESGYDIKDVADDLAEFYLNAESNNDQTRYNNCL